MNEENISKLCIINKYNNRHSCKLMYTSNTYIYIPNTYLYPNLIHLDFVKGYPLYDIDK